MSDNPLKWGIVSAGRISKDFTTGLLSDPNHGHKIIAIASRDLKHAEKLAKERKVEKFYGSYEEMANDSEIEVFYVSVINNMHYPIVKMLLNLGKNVLCEKPLGMNVRETEEMIKLAEVKKVFFMEGMWARFFPVQERLREELKKKTLGNVKLVISSFGQTAGSDMQRLFKPEYGGGCMMDMGVYCIAFSLMVYGEMPKKITPIGFLNKDGVDELDSVTFEFSDDRLAVFQIAFTTEVPKEGIVCGTKGVIKIKPPFWCSDTIVINDEEIKYPFPPAFDKSVYNNAVGFMYEANEVKRCIHKGLKESPIYTHKETLMVANLIEACRKIIGVKFSQDTAI